MNPVPCPKTESCPKPIGHKGPCPGQMRGYHQGGNAAQGPCPKCPAGSGKWWGHGGRHIGSQLAPRRPLTPIERPPDAPPKLFPLPMGRYERFVPFDAPERPTCDLCGEHTHKRAVFVDRRRNHRGICAKCAVRLHNRDPLADSG